MKTILAHEYTFTQISQVSHRNISYIPARYPDKKFGTDIVNVDMV